MYNGKSVACVMVVAMFPAAARHSHAPILGVALLATMPLCTSWCTYKQTAESRDEEWSKAADDRTIAIVTKRGHEAEARLPDN